MGERLVDPANWLVEDNIYQEPEIFPFTSFSPVYIFRVESSWVHSHHGFHEEARSDFRDGGDEMD